MPDFTFDMTDSKQPHPDPLKVVVANRDEARRQAIVALVEMAHEALPDGNTHDFVALVEDGEGNPIFRAVLSLRAQWLD